MHPAASGRKLRASRPDAFFKELRGSRWSLDAPAPLELRGEASMQPQGTWGSLSRRGMHLPRRGKSLDYYNNQGLPGDASGRQAGSFGLRPDDPSSPPHRAEPRRSLPGRRGREGTPAS